MKNKLLVILALFIFGCSAALQTPTQTDADRGAAMFPGYSLVDLNEGKQLYVQHCGSCHKHKRPKSQTVEGWKEEVPKMVKKVNKKAGSTVIDAGKEDLILKYVLTMRESTKQVN